MTEVRKTEVFEAWLSDLRDIEARTRIIARIDRLTLGNPGDIAPVGEGVSELRIHHGPGYRVYLTKRGEAYVILLCGGDKRTQTSDIKRAKAMARAILSEE